MPNVATKWHQDRTSSAQSASSTAEVGTPLLVSTYSNGGALIDVTAVAAGGQLELEFVTGRVASDMYPMNLKIIISAVGNYYLPLNLPFANYVTTQRTVSGANVTYSVVTFFKNN